VDYFLEIPVFFYFFVIGVILLIFNNFVLTRRLVDASRWQQLHCNSHSSSRHQTITLPIVRWRFQCLFSVSRECVIYTVCCAPYARRLSFIRISMFNGTLSALQCLLQRHCRMSRRQRWTPKLSPWVTFASGTVMSPWFLCRIRKLKVDRLCRRFVAN